MHDFAFGSAVRDAQVILAPRRRRFWRLYRKSALDAVQRELEQFLNAQFAFFILEHNERGLDDQRRRHRRRIAAV